MFFEILLAIFCGILAGIFTGLIPGVHVNLVSLLVISLGFGFEAIFFIASLAITHTFLDVIPAVLLGAPSSDTALGVLPGHRYFLRGDAYSAIFLTLIGSYFGLLSSFILIPLWYFLIGFYHVLLPIMGWLLFFVSGIMIISDSKRYWALLVYLLSGCLGYLLLNHDVVKEPLFVLFTGLFGVSTLLFSLNQDNGVKEQFIKDSVSIKNKKLCKSLIAGNISGFLASSLPGLGAAQGSVLGMWLTGKNGDDGFLVLMGAVNTVGFSLSILSWLLIDKARNGAVVAISSLSSASADLVIMLFFVVLVAGSFSTIIGFLLARLFVRLIHSISYKNLTISVICLLVLLSVIISGIRGLLVLLISCCVGLIPAVVKCRRSHAMGCLMMPVALYFTI